MNRYYIGLATTFHDPAIAIVGPDGQLCFAEAAERYLQVKRALNQDPDALLRMPELLRQYCDKDAELVVATTWSGGFATMLRLATLAGAFRLERLRRVGSRINRTLLEDDDELVYASLINQMQEKAGLGVLIGAQQAFGHSRIRLRRFPHHLTHAAHACYTSAFSSAVCAVIDGMGEFGSMAFYRYDDGMLRPIGRHWGRESLGFLFALATDLCGYDWRAGEEWKVMGLASYGHLDPELYDLFGRIYRLDRGRLRFASRRKIQDAVALLRTKVRARGAPPLLAADMAHVGQHVFSEIMTAVLRRLFAQGISRNLALGGGCALNSSYNGTITAATSFENLHVPCAPGDDGNAVGAALLAYAQDHPQHRRTATIQIPYVGSAMPADVIERFVLHHGGARLTHWPQQIHRRAAQLLADGKLLGWVQGRAEFGPRALGNRSILADPRKLELRARISSSVKLREDFRPFAPAILHEFGAQYFENYQEAPYMERTLRFRSDVADQVPAVVHVDQTGRVQTVKREWNARFFDLIEAFRQITGVPLLLNTSFNIMGRPLIHSLEDAVGMFYTTGLDALIVDDFLLEK